MLFLLLIGEALLTSLVLYVIGRILLPEVGLTAPSFWIWFWVSVFWFALDGVRGFIKGMFL